MLPDKESTTSLPNILEDFFGDDFLTSPFERRGRKVPAANIVEKNDSYEIEIAAPGFKKDDFAIDLDNNVLSISAQKEGDTDKDQKNYLRQEFASAELERSFTVSEECDTEGISASFNDGVLTIHVPKKEVTKTGSKKSIEIE